MAEIEALYKERAEKEASPAAGLKPGYHVRYQFAADRSILVDVKKVVASYLDKSAQYSAQDQALVEKFLESFLDAMFPAAHAGASSAGGVDDMAVDGETTTSTRSAILTMFGNTNFYVFYRLFCVGRLVCSAPIAVS